MVVQGTVSIWCFAHIRFTPQAIQENKWRISVRPHEWPIPETDLKTWIHRELELDRSRSIVLWSKAKTTVFLLDIKYKQYQVFSPFDASGMVDDPVAKLPGWHMPNPPFLLNKSQLVFGPVQDRLLWMFVHIWILNPIPSLNYIADAVFWGTDADVLERCAHYPGPPSL